MLLEVVEDVDERIAHFARRSKQSRVIPVRPERTAPPAQPVHEAGDPDGQPAHTALESHWFVRFHHQVQMIPLDAEVQNTEPAGRAGPKRALDRNEKSLAPEGGASVRARSVT